VPEAVVEKEEVSSQPAIHPAGKASNAVNQDNGLNGSDLPEVLNHKITLKGNNLPLKIYFSTISQVTGYNIITTPDIDSEKTSINLENIEVWRALKSLLYKFGYGFKVSQEDLIITESETRIFNITMPAVDQTFTDETSNASFANNTTNNTASSQTNTQSQQVDVGTKIYYENSAPKLSLWSDLENNVKSMITANTGSYSINKASGSIVVTDKPQVLDKIGDLVSTINESLSRQQSFEIQIIEVTLNNDYETGIDWNAIVASGIKGLNNISLNTNFTAQGFSSGQLLSLSSTGPTTTSGPGSNGVSILVKALDSMGSVNIVSKPSITVSNMFPCIIQEVTSIPYISGTGTTLGNSVTQSEVTTSQVSDGLTMRLEAKIDDSKTVLNISAAVNTLDSMTTVPVGNGLSIQEPQVSTKSITTNVSVEPGKTLILGGLISTTKSSSQQGIPYLDKIPFLGGAFQYKGKSSQKTELVIIITPKVAIRNY
jgi:MSHA biogenesis protein MshL